MCVLCVSVLRVCISGCLELTWSYKVDTHCVQSKAKVGSGEEYARVVALVGEDEANEKLEFSDGRGLRWVVEILVFES